MQIDINDLNFHAYDEGIKLGYNKERYRIKPAAIARALVDLVVKGTASIFYFFVRRYDPACMPCEVAMFAFSEANNKRSLFPLLPHIPGSVLFTNENLMLKRVWFYAMLYSPLVLFRCITYTGKKKRFYCRFFRSFCKTYGTYIEAKSMLRSMRPKMVVVANDHSYTSRSFFRAAQHLQIKTAYVQHASVNKFFPALEFDFVFLDGLESYEKYIDGKSCKSRVFLSGNPRFDIISDIENETAVSGKPKIGIAVNPLDKLELLEGLLNQIRSGFPKAQISVRPHPSSDMSYWERICLQLNCELSNSFKENPFHFIARHQVFISGNSSFHLDVCMARKQSFFFNFSGRPVVDAYNYLKNKLVDDISADPVSAIRAAFEAGSSATLHPQAQYFVGNFNTSYWGRSAELIGKTIAGLLAADRQMSDWKPLIGAEVYEICA